jgi:hypothetical protein
MLGQVVFIVGQQVVVSGRITLQSLHCPFAIEKEQYSPDRQPSCDTTLHVLDVEVSRINTKRKNWHAAAMTKRMIQHPAAARHRILRAAASSPPPPPPPPLSLTPPPLSPPPSLVPPSPPPSCTSV